MKGTHNNSLSPSTAAAKTSKLGAASMHEVEVFISVLLLSMLAGAKAYQPLASASLTLIDYIAVLNRRTLDFFQARAYHFLSLAQEKLGSLAAIRAVLVSAHRTATLRHDEYGQAVLINLLLRNFLSYKLYDQANKLVQKASFPEAASNNQLVRYLYYKGRIQAVQLEYSESFASLTQALRKAPQAAVSFRAQVQQFAVIVQLLTGEIPERSVFHADKSLAPFLKAYYELTFAVRSGELPVFARALSAHAVEFEKDDTYNLILRLQANVIKTGLRSIATSYSRISFASIASKLELGTAADAECLCAKVSFCACKVVDFVGVTSPIVCAGYSRWCY
jgi:26S proteasome regulatory subunit N3